MHGQSALAEAASMTRMTMSANAISGRGGLSMMRAARGGPIAPIRFAFQVLQVRAVIVVR